MNVKSLFKHVKANQKRAITLVGMGALHSLSFAATLGGLTTAQSAATDVKTGLFALVGVVALIYMVYLGVMAFTEKKSWADFGWGAIHVSAVGGSVALGTWAWSLFQ